ncbi:enoyl-CoA hydratase [Constrictibacter sp. MBR-5]|uniref:enoyl-CoA hydratase/isomerase family protein n=1 Tax=Constrictibacter sp. MBR-5 TaxID=3156467 RepID=UPI003391A056
MFRLEADGPKAVITLSRPPVNAINNAWIAGFGALLDRLDADGEIAVLHIRSDQQVFCAGADLRQVEERFGLDDGHLRFSEEVAAFQRLFRRIETLPCVTVAEIGGTAMGGGLELTLACDLRIAAEEAWLGLPEVTIGLVPGAGGTQRLTRLCGRSVASRMILTGDPVRGSEAVALGLVQWAAPRDRVAEQAEKLVARLGGLSRPALRACKSCIAEAARPGGEGFEREVDVTRDLIRTPEARRLVEAFLNKRKG